ncbi:MAG: methyl-accepting chemotaxis protein [Pseudomonas sp.]
MTGLASSREVAAQVSSTLQQTGEVIARLNEQARDISNMVNTIRGVAEQTNLLALNAAIEAARAGEYGRGFAVVADEVRKLAFNTSSATNDISSVVSKNLEVTKQVSSAIASVDELSRSNQDKIDALEQVVQEIESGARSVVEAVSSIR